MDKSGHKPSIIVADDDKSVRLVITQALKKQGYLVHSAATAAGMWDLTNAKPEALLITDVGFPDGDALDMLPRLQARHPALKVIVMSARANLLTAVKSQQQGVVDYLPKPFELGQLIETTKAALAQDSDVTASLTDIEVPKFTYAPLLGRSAIMQDVYKSLARLSTQHVPVLIEAEPGSFKADVARALHDMGSDQSAPYIVHDCAKTLPEQHKALLFGTDGAFSKAQNGTLFINNIETMDAEAQLYLISVLEDTVNLKMSSQQQGPKRLLVGANEKLKQAVENGQFREDLYFKLSVAPIYLPALRDRKQDIPAMAHHFCQMANDEFNTQRQLSLRATSALQEADWLGNIRELEFIVRRLVMQSQRQHIDADEVYKEMGAQKSRPDAASTSSLTQAADLHIRNYFEALDNSEPPSGLYDRILEEVERPLIIRTLHLTRGNQIKAAQILGLNRNTLRKKIEMLHISKDRNDYREA